MMNKNNVRFFKNLILFSPLLFISLVYSDNYKYNLYNNSGVVGLINIPTARSFDEGSHGITVYDGTPDQKVTLSSNPYDWLEASFFYSNIQGLPYPGYEYQDYKDKGFNLKIQLKKEGVLPAIAIGLNDFAGTGFYTSEYIVSSYGIKDLDLHFGLGFGALSDTGSKFNNPFASIHDSFETRSGETEGCRGGCFNYGQYFSGKEVSPFYGFAYKLKDNLVIKFERDTTLIDRIKAPYPKRESDFSYGFDYLINDNFSLGASYERGGFFSLKFVYKNSPKQTAKKYEFQEGNISENDSRISKLIKSLEANGIAVSRISETAGSLGLELSQVIHPDLNLVNEIISTSVDNAGIDKSIKTNIEIANLKAVTELDDSFKEDALIIYQKPEPDNFFNVNSNNRLRFQPFIASREEFFKGALLAENDTEFTFGDNLFFNINLKYSLYNNFGDFRFESQYTAPAQVRSDVKDYLKNMDKGILIGRAQFDYLISPTLEHHFMFSGGILENMFSGIGMEYLYFKQETNYAFGFEAFSVRKRDYEWRFGHLDYENDMVKGNFYLRNYGSIPFDMKISAGEYLAGDKGFTLEFSRTFEGGLRLGAFASFTNVSREDFGEGSFDKGVFFSIPIFGNLVDYTWKPLTKDPAATLVRRTTLHSLLVKLRPIK